jgi:hypothetical protein
MKYVHTILPMLFTILYLIGFTFIFLPWRVARPEVYSTIENFDTAEGKLIGDGKRNKVKFFMLDRELVNIKSFKIPVFINKIIYRYFRKSKARRSFEYARILLQKDIGTPEPIAFYEQYSFSGLGKSYYISEHLDNDWTFRDLITFPRLPDHECILRQFTHFCFELHEKGVQFLDHSPGNTLIKKISEGKFRFYLVDLNRMRFRKSISFEQRMKNLQRLTTNEEIIKVISNEYAKWYDKPEDIIFKSLWSKTITFAKRYARRKEFKKKLRACRQYFSGFSSGPFHFKGNLVKLKSSGEHPRAEKLKKTSLF